MDIQIIRQAILNGEYRVTRHAYLELKADSLEVEDVIGSVVQGEIIEDYPQDYPLPSCLIYGDLINGSPLHSVWAYNEIRGQAILVTAYFPSRDRWVDWRTRRK